MMKKIAYIFLILSATLQLSSCVSLDLNPPAAASSGNWYADTEEVRLSLNDLYRSYIYYLEAEYFSDRRTDDWAQRDQIYDVALGTVNSEWSAAESMWNYTYKGIVRANMVDESLDRLAATATPDEVNLLRAEARFFRAFLYSRLITLYGDVPFYTKYISIEEARQMGRTDKAVILEQIYRDFEYAATYLPVVNESAGVYRVSRGAAYALWARIALGQYDYETAKAAAKACMDLNHYSLYPDYGELFRDKTMNCEMIFAIANSAELEQYENIKSWVLRSAGGNNVAQPSWELLAAYTCTDGKRIDESPLFDPQNPYKNRDPRCTYTFVEPGTSVYGVVFDPRPSVLKVTNATGALVDNKDNLCVDTYAPRNGCTIRKGAQPEWGTTLRNDNPYIIMRYADVLLMYAEAQIELNEIDDETLKCINMVRARAYKVDYTQTDSYPAVTTRDQTELRRILRNERRVEFAWEGRRYFDLLRWKWFDKAFGHDYYALPTDKNTLKNLESSGKWFWGGIPDIDEDGFADFEALSKQGYCQMYGERFFDPKIYLWPIPYDEVALSGGKLSQNDGY